MINLTLAKLRMEMIMMAQGTGSIKEADIMNLVKDAVVFARTKINPRSIIEFICKMPQMYIVILIVVKKILESGSEYATFERIFETYKNYRKVKTIILFI